MKDAVENDYPRHRFTTLECDEGLHPGCSTIAGVPHSQRAPCCSTAASCEVLESGLNSGRCRFQ
jgi:hypothetical protein